MASEKLSTLIHADTEKTTPVNADEVPILDSADSFKFAKVTWTNIKATLKTYLDTLYSAIGHTHAGTYEPADATILKQADVDDTPVNGVTTAPVSSNWAYDHAALTTAHGVSSFGASLVDDADAGTARTTLGLGTAATTASTDYATAGHNHSGVYEAAGAVSTHAAVTSAVHGISTFGASLVDDADAGTARTTLGLGTAATTAATDYATAAHNHSGTYVPVGADAADLGSGAATDNYVLTADGLGGAAWEAAAAGSGDVVGPSSSVDNTIPRFDSTTGKLIQGGVAILGDDGTFYLEGIAGQTTGNARGAGAIDLQTSRSAATQVASGANAVALGYRNTASSTNSFAVGNLSVASGGNSVALGYTNTASATAATALGRTSTASGTYACAMGYAGLADIESSLAIGCAGTLGIGQAVIQPTYTVTTDATQTQLNVSSGTYTLDITAKKLWVVTGTIAAMSDATDGYKCKGWEIRAMITRDNSNSTRIIGTPTITVLGNDADASGWSVDSITADDTNERLNINVTGEAATTIRWVAALMWAQVGH